MDRDFRAAWNAAFTQARFEDYKQRLQAETGPVPYRLAETPLFVPPYLRDRLFRASTEIMEQLATPAALEKARTQIAREFGAPRQDDLPAVMTVDFAVTKGEDGRLDGRVVELQAFPSIFAFTILQARLFDTILQQTKGIERSFHCFAGDLSYDAAIAYFRSRVLGGFSPEETILLEITPLKQKTLPDFLATQKLVGIDPVCVTEIEREGRHLYRRKDGRRLPIRRIFNRVVFDELEKKRPPMAFSFADDLEVSWFPHPNWYWMWSKFSLHLLDHPCVPRARLISELPQIPEDLENYVLKPLYSYAGAGVKVDVTAADVAAIPDEQRSGWILQRKLEYARELKTPEGHGVAAEIRIMCLRDDAGGLPKPFMNLVRLSRGKMLGIDFNKDFDWVGSSVAMWPRGS